MSASAKTASARQRPARPSFRQLGQLRRASGDGSDRSRRRCGPLVELELLDALARASRSFSAEIEDLPHVLVGLAEMLLQLA